MAVEEHNVSQPSCGGISAPASDDETVSDLQRADDDHGGDDAGVTRLLWKGSSVVSDGFEEGARQFPNECLLTAGMHNTEEGTEKHLTPSLRLETSLQLSPTSVTQSISSIPIPSPTLVEQAPKSKDPASGMLQDDPRRRTACLVDSYRWRKYGQKQIKSPLGSRSYYRCTNTQCSAKKIVCSDSLGHIIEMIYRSQHNHASPEKIKDLSGSKVEESVGPATKHGLLDCSSRGFRRFDPSTSSRKVVHHIPGMPARRKYISENDEEVATSACWQQQVSGVEPKQRIKRIKLSPEGSPLQSGKKAEVMVHAADNVGASSDGYRWRKYGKKMVKGNQHPRNYYRCTSAGCLARKQIESSSDDTKAVIITYKGKHDHEKPVHRRRHGSPSASLVASSPLSSVRSSSTTQQKGEDMPVKHRSSAECLFDGDSDWTGKAMELGGERAMESARTLLSMGLDAKSC